MQPNGSMGSGPNLNRQAAQAQFVKKPIHPDKKKKYFHVSNLKFIATLLVFGLIVWFLISLALG